jgi:hypothetical protein
MAANHATAANDPNFVGSPAVSYGAHYCSVPREVDPVIAACSFINSGLRIFNIQDPAHPREVAYFVSPPATSNGQKSDAAFSQPAFDAARREVWYSDATTGFWNVKLSAAAWPQGKAISPKPRPALTRTCASRRAFTIHIRRPRTGRIAHVRATLNGKRLKVTHAHGRFVARVRLKGRPKGAVRVRIKVRTSTGAGYRDSRLYHPCVKRA